MQKPMKMKVQCDVCEKAEATLLCCADEAALCSACDNKVHAANKLASKHQRVPLINHSSQSPKCDICQEKTGYFFCLEDRALLCRQCDVSIHSVNNLVAAHRRFLVTGVKVGLEPSNSISSPTKTFAQSSDTTNQKPQTSRSGPREVSAALHQGVQKGAGGSGTSRRGTVSEYFPELLPVWRMDEFLNLPELDNGYSFDEAGSSRADNANFVEGWTANSFSMEDVNTENCLAQVPEMPSPPTASGLYWPRRFIHQPTGGKQREDLAIFEFDDAPLVPDIGCRSSPPDSPLSKRRRLYA